GDLGGQRGGPAESRRTGTRGRHGTYCTHPAGGHARPADYPESMTIPRQIGPETGPRRALPDFSRSNATVERMVRDLRQPTGAMRAAHPVRTLVPAEAGRDIIMRCVVAAAALLLAAASAVLGVLLYLSLGEAGAPSVLGCCCSWCSAGSPPCSRCWACAS